MKEALFSFLAFVVVYVSLSAIILRRHFKSQFRDVEAKFLGLRLVSFAAWWLIAVLSPLLWHPKLWLGIITLAVVMLVEVLLAATKKGFWQALGFVAVVGIAIGLGSLWQPSGQASVALFDVAWQAVYTLMLFASLLALGRTTNYVIQLLTKPFLSGIQDEVARMRFLMRSEALGIISAVFLVAILALTSRLDLRIWQVPIAVYILALGWGMPLSQTQRRFAAIPALLRAIEILAAIFVSYFLLREYVWTTFPPAQLPPIDTPAIVLGSVAAGLLAISAIFSHRMPGPKGVAMLAGLGPRMQLIGAQIDEIEDEEAKSRLLVEQAVSIRALSDMATRVGAGDWQAAHGAPQLAVQIENLEQAVETLLRKQKAEKVISLMTQNMRMFEQMSGFLRQSHLQPPAEFPAEADLGKQLDEARAAIQKGDLITVVSKAETVEALYSRLRGLENDRQTIQTATALIASPTDEVAINQRLCKIAARLELEHSELSDLLHQYSEASKRFADDKSTGFATRAALAAEMNSSWEKLEKSAEEVQKQILRESYEWRSRDPEGVYVYIPRMLKKNEVRHVVVALESKCSEPEVSLEFECGLLEIGTSSVKATTPSVGEEILSYDIWSETAGRASLQIVLQGVRSGPFRVLVLPSAREILEDAPPLLAISASLSTIVLLALRIPVATASAIGAGMGSVITAGVFLRRYFSVKRNRKR